MKKEKIEHDLLLTLSIINGIGHDFGKYTSYFQDHLKNNKGGKKSHHSFISAVFTAHLCNKSCEEHHSVFAPFAPLLCYISVLHHHGNLKAMEHVVLKPDDDLHDYYQRVKTMEIQIEDIKVNAEEIQKELSELGCHYSVFIPQNIVLSFIEEWPQTMKELKKYQRKINKLAWKEDPIIAELYFIHQVLYSALIDSDKHSASNTHKVSRQTIPPNIVDLYREDTFDVRDKSGMNGWRNKMYDTAISNIEHFNDPIATLTAPTGSGKTLMAYSIALKLRKKAEEDGRAPRIIYTLPFTSVIDQNYDQAEKIFEEYVDTFKQNQESFLLKNHHLADIQYHEQEERPVHEALLLTESWESEFIVTTYIQLLETLIGWRNRPLKKFSKLTNSIIILDEIQNIRAEYWQLLKSTFQALTNLFHCKIILMTATQPLIFSQEDTTELLESKVHTKADFFNSMDRVDLTFIPNQGESYSLDEWIEYFKDHYQGVKNYLAIFNTISSSIEVYNKMKERFPSKDYPDLKLIYLSTNIVPIERQRRITEIECLMEDYQVIVVSTQVIEAGVDLDFDVVYRDIGPIDSIIQAAGRCNRNGGNDRGEVKILPILRDNGQDEARLVYGKAHISISKELLPTEKISESDFLDHIDNYFTLIQKHINKDHSKELWKAIQTLHFNGSYNTKTYISDFQLIDENNSEFVDVYFEIDEASQSLWKEYVANVFEEENPEERFKKHLHLKKEIRRYVISAPLKYFQGELKDQIDLYQRLHLLHIPYYLLYQHYNMEYGIIRSQSEVEAWMM
ncbi:CRISPR-associated endonuclease/helicase Cas3 [Geomicrobium halophilum]|uniref:CRISPR-associated endonuclease/helicase Cas3 n=1 Tax=Geomicrobium halophilum TaxID=549000 RepID=A0A841PQ56_9BACL|nr:CRISPR-associated helicase Cas3' [Geomicrobium halophilum]MBB6450967.1 CRISPR-associated endonuclease/helicase Cas3 [Geomicrobium halophilum]